MVSGIGRPVSADESPETVPAGASEILGRKMEFSLAFIQRLCYNHLRDIAYEAFRCKKITGCGAVGSALDWGSRGREFKSRHSDQDPTCFDMSGLYILRVSLYPAHFREV